MSTSPISPYSTVARTLVDLARENKLATGNVAKLISDTLEPLSAPERIDAGAKVQHAILQNLGQAPDIVAIAIAAALGAPEALHAAVTATTQPPAPVWPLQGDLLAAPPSKKGLPRNAQGEIAQGNWLLVGLFADLPALLERGWAREPLLKSVADAVIQGLSSRDHSTRSAMSKAFGRVLLIRGGEGGLDQSLVLDVVKRVLDNTTINGVESQYLGIDDGKARLVPADIRNAYLAHLVKTVPPASEGASQAATGLRQLAFTHWVDGAASREYLLSDGKIRAAHDVLASATADTTRVLHKGSHLRGFASDGDVLYVSQHSKKHDGDDNAIATPDGTSIATGRWRAMSMQLRGTELLSLSVNNDVYHLEAFNRSDGTLARRITLPRPIHHVGAHNTALDRDGHLLYASTEHGSRDLIVSLNPKFDAKGAKRAENLDRDIVEPPRGFKVKGIAVEGDHAFVVLSNRGKTETRVVRYDLPALTNPTDMLASPLPNAGYWDGQLAFFGDRMVLSGGDSLYVFERRGEHAHPVHEVPFEGLRDLRPRADGGADVVIQPPHQEATLVRLTADEVAVLLRKG